MRCDDLGNPVSLVFKSNSISSMWQYLCMFKYIFRAKYQV